MLEIMTVQMTELCWR